MTANTPQDIRSKFQPTPMEIWFKTPKEIRPGTYTSTDMVWINWKQDVYVLRLNMQSNQGEQMWNQITDLLDRETPRSQRIPEPAVVGNRVQWTLTVDKVPHVKLTGSQIEVPKEQVVPVPPKVEARPDEFPCRQCGEVFDRERGRWMHERRRHGIKDSFIPQRKVLVA